MKSIFTIVYIFCFVSFTNCQELYHKYLNNQSLTYSEAIQLYKELAKKHSKNSKLFEYGTTDAGLPLHLFVISKNGDFNPASLKQKNKRIILINNGIHPGEPCGIDASVNLAKDILTNKDGMISLIDNVVLCIIPVYNIGGSLNRGCCSRVNQDGPLEYGFRGNARNLDLNRDFIKCDSENSKAFTEIFHSWDPDVFVDTHTTNGADYQYVMTLIASQKDKLEKSLGNFLHATMLPELYSAMDKKNYPMCPYVNTVKETPENGLAGFLETPRYSTGYTALFNTLGFVTEAHMLKPFPERVKATYEFLNTLTEYVNKNSETIKSIREEAIKETINKTVFPVSWQLDTTQFDWLNFKGYEAGYKTSEVTGLERLYYDASSPFEKQIKYFNTYHPETEVTKPAYYVVPKAWKEVIERLKLNKVKLNPLLSDSTLSVEVYYFENYKTPERPYEGHYLHSNIKVRKELQELTITKENYLVKVDQSSNRYIMETLEPQAVDGFFAWNFFDEVLQQKEWFSSYVFEDLAVKILQENEELKKEFEEKRQNDKNFAGNAFAQLYFIYQRSAYFEKVYLRHPVYRISN